MRVDALRRYLEDGTTPPPPRRVRSSPCVDCGDPVVSGKRGALRQRCRPCGYLRDRERAHTYRDANRDKAKAYYEGRRAAKGIRPRATYFADKRKRMLEAYAPIKRLLDEGWTYEAIAAQLGTTKNAAIGIAWRARQLGD